jgi:hypothetical protein
MFLVLIFVLGVDRWSVYTGGQFIQDKLTRFPTLGFYLKFGV